MSRDYIPGVVCVCVCVYGTHELLQQHLPGPRLVTTAATAAAAAALVVSFCTLSRVEAGSLAPVLRLAPLLLPSLLE